MSLAFMASEKTKISALYAALYMATLSSAGLAAEPRYPDRPIRMIVPFPPAGSTDIVGRILAQPLGERLGTQIVIDNRPGAHTIIGTDIAAKASPDGYTMLFATSGHGTNPALYKLPFDPIKDFTPILLLTTSANVLVVNPGQPIRNLPELIAQANAAPGQITYATGGVGTVQHLAVEMLKLRAGINVLHVPYKGAGPALVDAMSGHVTMVAASIPPVMPHLKTGRLRAILVTSSKRAESLPSVPTIAEQGFPGFEVIYWIGLMGPAKVPVGIVDKLHGELNSIMRIPAVRQQLVAQGADPVGGTPAEFMVFLKQELKMWAELVKTTGLKAE
jgi:tripartite-type tricarboxylate transporter receptor subunit TctC